MPMPDCLSCENPSQERVSQARDAIAIKILTKIVEGYHRKGRSHDRIRAEFDEIYPEQPRKPRLRAALDRVLADIPPNQ